MEAVHDLAREKLRITRRIDTHLPQHLPRDHLDVLVVDRYTLAPVDALHLGNQVVLNRLPAEHSEDVLRVLRTIGQRITSTNHLARGDEQARRRRDQVLPVVNLLVAHHNFAALPSEDTRNRCNDLVVV